MTERLLMGRKESNQKTRSLDQNLDAQYYVYSMKEGLVWGGGLVFTIH